MVKIENYVAFNKPRRNFNDGTAGLGLTHLDVPLPFLGSSCLQQ